MVVPEGTTQKAQALLLRGEPSYFYFNASIADRVAGIEGIACASPQFFLTSLESVHCDFPVQLIAYDPVTDFVVQPWIAEKYSGTIGDGQIVIGSSIKVRENNTVQFFSDEYPVAARLSKSAGGYDTSVFMTMNTMRLLIDRAHQKGFVFLADRAGEEAVSAVLARVDPTKNPALLADAIKRKNEGVEVLVSQGIFSSISETLSGLVSYIHIFSAVLWVLAIIVLAAVFSGSVHERKKEFAVLRILGATRIKLIGIVLSESSITGIAGGLAGITLASLLVFPFSTYISERLALPYLEAPLFGIILLALSNLFLSFIVGPLASLRSALKISRAETYITMREGE
jgi:putative ABC transport system permease protein